MHSAQTVPVAVIMGRRQIDRGHFVVASWQALGVVAGEEKGAGSPGCRLVREDAAESQYLWQGLTLRLYRDSAESYWYNLTGERPALYVLCHERDDGTPEPFVVTADHDEASAATEGNDRVFATAIPPELYQRLEHFVVEHHVPRERKRRKRKDWLQGEGQ